MLAEFNAAAQSLKALGDLVRMTVDLNNSSAVTMALLKVQEEFLVAQGTALAAQEKISNLLSEIDGLKEELRHVKDWEERVKAYELTTTAGGAVVYRFKGEPGYFVCPSCYEKRTIEILQDKGGSFGYYECPGCKVEYQVKQKMRREVQVKAISD